MAGAWLLAARMLLGGGSPDGTTPDLPEGRGPWSATVTALGTPREGTQRFTVALEHEPETVLAVTAPRYPAVEPGDLVRLDGRPAAPPDGGYGDFLRRTGVSGTLRSSGLSVVARASSPAGLLERTRRAAGDALARALPEPAAGLAAGILVGLRDRVDRDLAAAFTATGLSHVVAISGWNIALVAGLVGALLAGRARRTRSGAILVAIVVYTILAGASASVVRAAAMAGVALLARESGRPGTAAAALGWAVALLVLAVPASAADVGLQLSAAATAGLIAWSTPLTAAIGRRAGWLPGWVREGLGVSLAAQAATLPIVLLAFGRLAPLSPLTNLVVVPLVPLAMAAGTLALLGGALAAAGAPALVATLAGIPGALVLGILIGIVRVAAGLPLASVTLAPPVAAALAVLLVIGLGGVILRRRVAGALRELVSRSRRAGGLGRTGRSSRGRAGHRAARGNVVGCSGQVVRCARLVGQGRRRGWPPGVAGAWSRGARAPGRAPRGPGGSTGRAPPSHRRRPRRPCGGGPRRRGGDAPRWTRPRRRAGRRAGRRDPCHGPDRRPDARRRRPRSGSAAGDARRARAAVGSPDRPPGPHASPRGSCRRPPAGPRAVPGRTSRRARHARPQPGYEALRGRHDRAWGAVEQARRGRQVRARRDRPGRPLAGRRPRPDASPPTTAGP